MGWFNNKCGDAVQERRRTLRALRDHFNDENLKNYRIAKAKVRRITREARRESWKKKLSPRSIPELQCIRSGGK